MKTIKFRQKILDGNGNKSFHYWGFMRNGSFVSPIQSENGTYWTAQKNSEEYIDLSDKKEKEIYEGDILAYEGKGREVVEYENGCFWVGLKGELPALLFQQTKNCNPEVIGNIFENPNLLKEVK